MNVPARQSRTTRIAELLRGGQLPGGSVALRRAAEVLRARLDDVAQQVASRELTRAEGRAASKRYVAEFQKAAEAAGQQATARQQEASRARQAIDDRIRDVEQRTNLLALERIRRRADAGMAQLNLEKLAERRDVEGLLAAGLLDTSGKARWALAATIDTDNANVYRDHQRGFVEGTVAAQALAAARELAEVAEHASGEPWLAADLAVIAQGLIASSNGATAADVYNVPPPPPREGWLAVVADDRLVVPEPKPEPKDGSL